MHIAWFLGRCLCQKRRCTEFKNVCFGLSVVDLECIQCMHEFTPHCRGGYFFFELNGSRDRPLYEFLGLKNAPTTKAHPFKAFIFEDDVVLTDNRYWMKLGIDLWIYTKQISTIIFLRKDNRCFVFDWNELKI